MTIQELARRAHVTPRTIRYYVEQGILPPPERGRPAEYTTEHLRRLDLIKRLKEQYLPLEEIRDTMQRLSLEQVEELLNQYAPTPSKDSKLSSAADYIAHVLARSAAREELKRQAAPAPAPAITQEPVYSAPPPHPMTAPSQPFTTHWQTGAQQTIRGASTWQRVSLAPGIELHYLLTGDARVMERVTMLIEAARRILQET